LKQFKNPGVQQAIGQGAATTVTERDHLKIELGHGALQLHLEFCCTHTVSSSIAFEKL
jgi:hypothetical protein